MARLLHNIVYTLMFIIYFVEAHEEQIESNTNRPDLHCKDSETQDDCPIDCPSDYCPKDRYVDQSSCPRPVKCPPSVCKCRFNYRRAPNGTCIPTKDCPPFTCDGPHESYNPCPYWCPGENCSQATADGKCHLPGHLPVLNCKPACRCDQTYWRLNGTCVPYGQCPKETSTGVSDLMPANSTIIPTESTTQPATSTTIQPKCEDNEVVVDCPVDCPTDYCPKSRYEDQLPCPRPKKCPPPSCKCGFNQRRAVNGSCIPTRSCPPFECNGINEEYDPCPPYCPGESCSAATRDGKCHIFGIILIVLPCVPKCRCKAHHWRLNGTCVPQSQCPKQNETVIITPIPPKENASEPTTASGGTTDRLECHCDCHKSNESENKSGLDAVDNFVQSCDCCSDKTDSDSSIDDYREVYDPTELNTKNYNYDEKSENYGDYENTDETESDCECQYIENKNLCRTDNNVNGCDEGDIDLAELDGSLDCTCLEAENCDLHNENNESLSDLSERNTTNDCGCRDNENTESSYDSDDTDDYFPEINKTSDCGCGKVENIDLNDSSDEIDIGLLGSDCTCGNIHYTDSENDSNESNCDCKYEDNLESKEEYSNHHETTSKLPPICPKNEILVDCPVNCASEYCPKSRHYDDQVSCISLSEQKPNKCPPPACKCILNYRRAENGTCIPTEDCPPFECNGLHEKYAACPAYCPGESCNHATPDGKCHIIGRILIRLICKPACKCEKNYWRLNGTCVSYDECRKCINDNTHNGTYLLSNCE